MTQPQSDEPAIAATPGPPALAPAKDPEAGVASSPPLSEVFRLLDHPIVFAHPRRGPTPQSFWHEHIPFAMLLVDLLRPRVLVELGTQYGVSYCAFCQAVQELGLTTGCWAVDTWEGDAHTCYSEREVLDDLRAHHDPLYSDFSTLLRCTFDESLGHFSDGAIDLLHIDGYHTYEAVRHDFETWLPKLSSSAVVLFHDTNVHKYDFGVYRLFEELKPRYRHFEFLHGSGLGVLAIGNAHSPELAAVLNASDQEAEWFRTLFASLGFYLTSEQALYDREKGIKELEAEARDLRDHLAECEKYIAEYERDVPELVSEVGRYEKAVQEYRDCLAEQVAANQQLMTNLAEYEQAARAQSVQLAHLEAKCIPLNSFRGLLSETLRAAGRAVKRRVRRSRD